MSPLPLRGSSFLWVLAIGIFAGSADDSFAASISASDYGLERASEAPQRIDAAAPGETGHGQRYTFKLWNSEDGLPKNSALAIAQARDGYLWVGTVNGLARFDGVRFETYTAANTPELFSDTINVLYEDRSRRLWVGTMDGGIACYDQGRFTLFSNTNGLRSITVNAVSQDGDGMLWVGTAGGLHRMVSPERFERVPAELVPVEVIAGLRTTDEGDVWVITLEAARLLRHGKLAHQPIQFQKVIRCFELDRSGDLWLGFQDGGIARVRAGTMTVSDEALPVGATALHRDRDGVLWLGSSTGELWRRNPPEAWSQVARPGTARILAIQDDSDGSLWLGIEGTGLARLRRKVVATYSMATNLPGMQFTSVAEDHQGRIWAGTMGEGLFLWEGNQFVSVPIAPSAQNVTALLCDRSGTLLCGTLHVHHGQLYRRATNDTFSIEPFGKQCRALFEDREGGLWVGKWRGGVEHYNDGCVTRYAPPNGLSNDRIYSIAQDKQGAIWIGTLKGLNRLADGKITCFYREDGLGGNDVRVLFVDRQGTLWAGSSGGGLTRYKDGRFTSITTREGLISDWIEQILEDDDGNLWLGSDAGLMRASLPELNDCASGRARYVHCIAFRREEGLLLPNSGTGFQPSSLKTRTGHLWFASEAGVTVIDPKRIKPNPKSPPVYIERLLIDGEVLDIHPKRLSSVTISPHKERLEFHYTGLDLSAPGAVRFKHKLEGYDREWRNSGTRREAAYTGVPPGRYQFHVTAANNDGFWNQAGAVLGVTITPPWWRTLWFQGVGVIGLCGVVFGIYELRVFQHKKARAVQESFARRLIESQEQERKRLAHELHDSLGQSLQIIKGRTQLGSRQISNPARCAEQFEEIDETVSRAIHEVRAISHALRPAELDQLGLTKAIEWMVENVSGTSTARFASELENLDGLFSPEMEISLYRIIQEGLNNVVKHAAATEVILELKRESNVVRFSLLDNGRGFLKTDWKSNGSLGLESIAERAKFLAGTFEIQSAPGKGTRLTVLLSVPPPRA